MTTKLEMKSTSLLLIYRYIPLSHSLTLACPNISSSLLNSSPTRSLPFLLVQFLCLNSLYPIPKVQASSIITWTLGRNHEHDDLVIIANSHWREQRQFFLEPTQFLVMLVTRQFTNLTTNKKKFSKVSPWLYQRHRIQSKTTFLLLHSTALKSHSKHQFFWLVSLS